MAMWQVLWERHHDGSQSLLCQATDEPRRWAVKVARNSPLVFAVEAIAVSQAQALAQEQKSWQGRVFLPTLQAVGDGGIADAIGQEDTQGASLLVMELAHGTLEGHDKLAGDALLMVAWAIASTLALLNAGGFIHGDLKPSNILWRKNRNFTSEIAIQGLSGWPLLTDFGSAQSFHSMGLEGQPVKRDEEIQTHCWSPAYAAPEVRKGLGKIQTMRSDMYSYAKTIEKDQLGCLAKGVAGGLRQVPSRGPKAATQKFHGHRSCFGRGLPNVHLMG